MSDFDLNKSIDDFVDIVSGGIFSAKARQEVAREYAEHIEDSMMRYQLGGATPKEAFYKACDDLGSPEKIRRMLANFYNRGKFIKVSIDWRSIRQHISFFVALIVFFFTLKFYEPAGDMTVAICVAVFIVIYGILFDICAISKRKLRIPFLHHFSKIKVIMLSFGVCSNLYFVLFVLSLFPIVYIEMFFVTFFPAVVMVLPIFASVADKLEEWKIPKKVFWSVHASAFLVIFVIGITLTSIIKKM